MSQSTCGITGLDQSRVSSAGLIEPNRSGHWPSNSVHLWQYISLETPWLKESKAGNMIPNEWQGILLWEESPACLGTSGSCSWVITSTMHQKCGPLPLRLSCSRWFSPLFSTRTSLECKPCFLEQLYQRLSNASGMPFPRVSRIPSGYGRLSQHLPFGSYSRSTDSWLQVLWPSFGKATCHG